MQGGRIVPAMIDWAARVRPALATLAPYDPGPSPRRVDGLAPVHLNRNEDLFEPFPGALEAAAAELANAWRYPDESFAAFREAVAGQIGTTPERIVPGHGIQALIGALATLLLDPGAAVVVPAPSYGLYAQACAAHGAAVERVPLRERRLDLEALAAAARRVGARIAWVCDPNNPTGSLVGAAEWETFLAALPEGCTVVADEAYVDFVEPAQRLARVRDVEAGRPLVVLRTFSKLYGLAGLRLGYCVADPQLARLLDVVQEPFNVNRPALAAGLACLARPEFARARAAAARAARELLARRLEAGGVEVAPSAANFVLAAVGGDDLAFAAALATRHAILVRPGAGFGLPGHVRITIGPPELMERVAAAIIECSGDRVHASGRGGTSAGPRVGACAEES
jgi:histidinol-phosphate aminotransferase